ncbi:MAG: UDP-3-O-acyl-N-acetylglucosamine deacetylase, partial [Chromatiales bacterium]
MECQQTLRTSIRATGAGSRTGDRVDLILRPAPVDTGVVFRRVDLPEPVAIPARVEHADGTLLSTTLQRGSIAVSAVEHLLAAAAGLGIDNLYVDITGPELPH